MEDLVEPQELLTLALHQRRDGDAGPAGDDIGDLGVGDLLPQQALPAGGLLQLGGLVRKLLLEPRPRRSGRWPCRAGSDR